MRACLLICIVKTCSIPELTDNILLLFLGSVAAVKQELPS